MGVIVSDVKKDIKEHWQACKAQGSVYYAKKVPALFPDDPEARQRVYYQASLKFIGLVRERSDARYGDKLWVTAVREYIELHTFGTIGSLVQGVIAIPLTNDGEMTGTSPTHVMVAEPWLSDADKRLIHDCIDHAKKHHADA